MPAPLHYVRCSTQSALNDQYDFGKLIIMKTAWPTPVTKPRRLRPGARVAVVTPCWGGPATFPHRFEIGKRQLTEALEVDLVEMRHACADAAWLDRNPKARAADLMEAFSDPSIDGIISSIGGDDSDRLLPFIDLDVIARNPKVFLGYSNTTVLSFAFLKAGLVSFYGPAVMSGFAENGGPSAYMIDSVKRALFSGKAIGKVEPNLTGWTAERLSWADPANQLRRRALQPSTGPRLISGRGRVRGRLIGGCADTLECLKGTTWWPPIHYWRDALLFYETSEEAPSPRLVGRWLRNLAGQGVLEVLGGILFARPGGQVDATAHGEYDRAILRVLDETGMNDLPVVTNLDFGHTDPMFTIPYGVFAELDCSAPELHIVEAATQL